jgi:hypothetical protein
MTRKRMLLFLFCRAGFHLASAKIGAVDAVAAELAEASVAVPPPVPVPVPVAVMRKTIEIVSRM